MGWKTPVPNQRPAVLVPASQGRSKDLGSGIAVEVVVAEVGCDPVAEVPPERGGGRSKSDDGAGGVGARDETVRGSGGVRTDMSDMMRNGGRRAHRFMPYVPRAMARSRYCKDTAWTLMRTCPSLSGGISASRMARVR